MRVPWPRITAGLVWWSWFYYAFRRVFARLFDTWDRQKQTHLVNAAAIGGVRDEKRRDPIVVTIWWRCRRASACTNRSTFRRKQVGQDDKDKCFSRYISGHLQPKPGLHGALKSKDWKYYHVSMCIQVDCRGLWLVWNGIRRAVNINHQPWATLAVASPSQLLWSIPEDFGNANTTYDWGVLLPFDEECCRVMKFGVFTAQTSIWGL